MEFNQLFKAAKEAASHAYAPYSSFKVGAAAIADSGEIVSGCNVENASYGLTVCAERNCIAQAILLGEKSLNCLLIYTEQEQLTPPCGACRQVISEFFDSNSIVIAANHLEQRKQWTVAELLPDAFTPKQLKDTQNKLRR